MAGKIKRKAKSIMVQGTSSHVGKSLIAAALCRVLKDRGLSVAPFKAQNMALNSFVTREGAEIGRAQAFQAEAAGVPPTVDMNPVLLKPTGDSESQVIIQGKVYGAMTALEYHAFKRHARRYVLESLRRLERVHDVIVIEGAGSPAEVNLRENDIANMGIAEMAKSPVLLVGDIDRGGVFASLVGTLEILSPGERKRIKGFIINKFRGSYELLEPGLRFLEGRTGLPVLGVIPFMEGMIWPEEDGVALLERRSGEGGGSGRISIKVIRLPRISNFTDFDPLRLEPSVSLEYIDAPEEIRGAKMVVIPGSKNTISDLRWLKGKGFPASLKRFLLKGGAIAGICGGFQMLGKRIFDPFGVEGMAREEEGLGLLDSETVLEKDKKTYQVEGKALFPRKPVAVKGYEIHMGESSSSSRGGERPFAAISKRNGKTIRLKDGAVSRDGRVWGTYIHGIFDNDSFRSAVLAELSKGGTAPLGREKKERKFSELREKSIERLASTVEESVNLEELFGIMGLEPLK